MITNVNYVLVANAACPASYSNTDALNAGEIALFDENRKLITSAALAAAAKSIYVGLCKGTMKVANPSTGALEDKKEIEFSVNIQRNGIRNVTLTEYEEPVQQKITIAAAGATITAGYRYVLRIVYNDLYEHPGQFTHTYETVATSTDAETLLNALASQINKHPGRRVTASVSTTTLTLTALEKDDNEGKYSINEYSVVNMDASLYFTIPGALLSNIPEAVPGVTITKTAGTPGKGYWKQVRDAEMRNMGYKGIVFIDAYPMIVQDKVVDENTDYDCLIIEADNIYLSPDNQYHKDTPMEVQLYVKEGSLSSSAFKTYLDAFVSGSAE